MSAHVSWIDRVIDFVLLRPRIPVETGWQRTTPVQEEPPTQAQQDTPAEVPVYPILPPKPYQQGDTARAYHKSHTTGEMKPVRHITTSLRQLPPEKLREVVSKVPPGTIAPWQIANLPTAKTLDMSQLPQHVVDQMAPNTGFLGNPQSHSSPLRGSWSAEAPANWLNDVRKQVPPRTRTSWLAEQPTLHTWEEIKSLAENTTSEDTLEVPAYMKKKVEQKQESE